MEGICTPKNLVMSLCVKIYIFCQFNFTQNKNLILSFNKYNFIILYKPLSRHTQNFQPYYTKFWSILLLDTARNCQRIFTTAVVQSWTVDETE